MLVALSLASRPPEGGQTASTGSSPTLTFSATGLSLFPFLIDPTFLTGTGRRPPAAAACPPARGHVVTCQTQHGSGETTRRVGAWRRLSSAETETSRLHSVSAAA